MPLKTKLSLGLGFLFLIILAMVVFSSFYMAKLSNDAGNILKDNYNSIVYAKNMFSGLDDMTASINYTVYNSGKIRLAGSYLELFENGRNEFEKNLKAENANITEIHEKEYVETLNSDYTTYSNLCDRMKTEPTGSTLYTTEFLPVYLKIRQSIDNINDVNMQAVVRKNRIASKDSTDFIHTMALIGSICLILGFGYFWYFPFYISNSISYLSDKMKGLLKTVGIKLDIKTNDEAFIILQSINLLENKLSTTSGKPGKQARRK
jgi:hypothetical protein